LALSAVACNQTPPEVETLLTEKIDGQDAKRVDFATFGFVSFFDENEEVDVLKLVVLASEDPDACAGLGNDASQFLADLRDGQIAGTFVLTEATLFGESAITAGQTFKGDLANLDEVDPRFLVSDGSDFDVEAVDIEREGQIDVLDFDGQDLKANIFATLNQEQSGVVNDQINVPMSLQILRAPLCEALSAAIPVPAQ
jgi:hypothetical protein